MNALKEFEYLNSEFNSLDTFWDSLSEFIPLACINVNESNILLNYNTKFKSMIGARKNTLSENFWINSINKKSQYIFKNTIKFVLNNNCSRTVRILFNHSNGEIVWTSCQFFSSLDSFGIKSVLVFIIDQSYQHHLHERIHILSSQIEQNKNEDYTGVIQFSDEGNKTVFDDCWLQLKLGYDVNDVNSKFEGLQSILAPADLQNFMKWVHSLTSNKNQQFEVKFIQQNRKKVTMLCSGKRVVNSGVSTILVWCKDISENIKKEERLKELEISNLRSDKMTFIGELTSDITHDIGNDITLLGLSLDLVKAKKKKEILQEKDYDRFVTIVESTVERMKKMITGIKHLVYSKEESKFENVKLESFTAELNMLFDNVIFKEEINFKVETSKFKNDYVYCEPTFLMQALINLIRNSVDAITDCDDKWVSVIFENTHDSVRIKVKDSGKGIKEDIKKKIFKQYFTTKEKGKGTGIGLGVAQKVSSMHDGKFYLDENEENTTFVIEIPIK